MLYFTVRYHSAEGVDTLRWVGRVPFLVAPLLQPLVPLSGANADTGLAGPGRSPGFCCTAILRHCAPSHKRKVGVLHKRLAMVTTVLDSVRVCVCVCVLCVTL